MLPRKWNCNQRRKTGQDILGKTKTKKVVLKRTVVQMTDDLVLRRTVVRLAEEFVLKRRVDEQHKTSYGKKRYPNGQGFAGRRRLGVPNLEKNGCIRLTRKAQW